MKVIAKNGVNGKSQTAPFSGRIINISRHGACLLMPLGAMKSYEVYSKTYHNDSSYLEIKGSFRNESAKFIFTARPVWTDPFILDDMHAFKMGVEFLINPNGEQMNSIIDIVTTQ